MFTRVTQVAIAIALVAASQSAFAEEPPQAPAAAGPTDATPVSTKPRVHIDAAPAAALPLGNLASATGPALGAMLGVAYELNDRWDLVFQGGYLAGGTASYQLAGVTVTSSVSTAPVVGGVRYYFTDPGSIRLYALAEAGAMIVSVSSSASNGSDSATSSDSSTYLGSAVSLGAQLDILELRAGLLTADLGHAGSSTSALASLGFRFASL